MVNKNIFNFLVWEKRVAVLLSLDREKNFTQLRKEVRVTARSLSNTLKELINFGIVQKKRVKRMVFYSLTKKGKELWKKLKNTRATLLYEL